METVLEVSGLTVARSAGAEPAVDHVSFRLAAETDTALVGPNGAGKSTLLHALVGLIPRQAGDVRLDGVPLDGRSACTRLALMPQR
ncbi:MAG: ATP-binding cassette domain-containing protein, partial [Vulcanococcus sp.]